MMRKQPWLHSPLFDGAFILAPALVTALIVVLWADFFRSASELPLWAWLGLIVFIDVAHVYSTLYRTYFDPEEFARRSTLYTFAPIFVLLAGVAIYSLGSLYFWRTLAYLAVFHFVRQQYGFMRLYGGHSRLDRAAIYLATLYPIIYWHTHDRQFAWFIEGDFLKARWEWAASTAFAVYAATLAAYAGRELWRASRDGVFNLPKNLLLAGTAASWYLGIVAFDGDWAFTLTNVVSHGIPYMALIWAYGRKKHESPEGWARVFQARFAPAFIAVLFVLAYLEEGLWDAFVWRDHTAAFAFLSFLPQLSRESALTLAVPLLALPQATHYVLDGFIWKVNADRELARLLKGTS